MGSLASSMMLVSRRRRQVGARDRIKSTLRCINRLMAKVTHGSRHTSYDAIWREPPPPREHLRQEKSESACGSHRMHTDKLPASKRDAIVKRDGTARTKKFEE